MLFSWSTVSFLGVFILPWALGKLFSWLQAQKTSASGIPPKPRPATTLWMRFASWTLLFSIAYYAFAFLSLPPANIFTEMDLDIQTPTWMVRKRVQAHVEGLDPSSPDVERLTSMWPRLKSRTSRGNYALFGEEAFLECEFCTETTDYYPWLIMDISQAYLAALMVVGVVTAWHPLKTSWRTTLIGTLCFGMSLEGMFHLTADGRLNDALGLEIPFLYDTLLQARRVAFFILLSFLWMVENQVRWTDAELLDLALVAQSTASKRLALMGLQRSAVMRDPQLRQQFVEVHAKREVERRVILEDAEYKEAFRQHAERINLEALTRTAQEDVLRLEKETEAEQDWTERKNS
ncbi:MAG: hypothetical protein DHS80DRAFT_23960 [Piptocephalis tieghemiana]|nr:MAG: hypothetical protein DHS80DRAFT_23960 [Piptocephalis tieghemiana]